MRKKFNRILHLQWYDDALARTLLNIRKDESNVSIGISVDGNAAKETLVSASFRSSLSKAYAISGRVRIARHIVYFAPAIVFFCPSVLASLLITFRVFSFSLSAFYSSLLLLCE